MYFAKVADHFLIYQQQKRERKKTASNLLNLWYSLHYLMPTPMPVQGIATHREAHGKHLGNHQATPPLADLYPSLVDAASSNVRGQ